MKRKKTTNQESDFKDSMVILSQNIRPIIRMVIDFETSGSKSFSDAQQKKLITVSSAVLNLKKNSENATDKATAEFLVSRLTKVYKTIKRSECITDEAKGEINAILDNQSDYVKWILVNLLELDEDMVKRHTKEISSSRLKKVAPLIFGKSEILSLIKKVYKDEFK